VCSDLDRRILERRASANSMRAVPWHLSRRWHRVPTYQRRSVFAGIYEFAMHISQGLSTPPRFCEDLRIRHAHPAAGELRIGCTETMAAGFATAVIDRLSRQYPRVVFQLVPGDRDTLLSRELRQRTIDLAVAPTMGLSPEGDTEMEILFNDQFVVMAGSPTKWIRRRKLVLADLLDELWVLPPPESLPGQYIAQAFRAGGFQPPRAHVVSFPFRCIIICWQRDAISRCFRGRCCTSANTCRSNRCQLSRLQVLIQSES
jgi:hypothetical protein